MRHRGPILKFREEGSQPRLEGVLTRLQDLRVAAASRTVTTRRALPDARRRGSDGLIDATQGLAQAAAADVAARLVPARHLPAALPRPRVRRRARAADRGAECRLRAYAGTAPGGRHVAGGGSSQRRRRPLRRRSCTGAGPSPKPNSPHLPATASRPGPAQRYVNHRRLCPRARSVDVPGVGQSPGPPRPAHTQPRAAAAEAAAVRGGLPRPRGVQRCDGRVRLPCGVQRQRVRHAQPPPVQRRQERRAVARQPLRGRVRRAHRLLLVPGPASRAANGRELPATAHAARRLRSARALHGHLGGHLRRRQARARPLPCQGPRQAAISQGRAREARDRAPSRPAIHQPMPRYPPAHAPL